MAKATKKKAKRKIRGKRLEGRAAAKGDGLPSALSPPTSSAKLSGSAKTALISQALQVVGVHKRASVALLRDELHIHQVAAGRLFDWLVEGAYISDCGKGSMMRYAEVVKLPPQEVGDSNLSPAEGDAPGQKASNAPLAAPPAVDGKTIEAQLILVPIDSITVREQPRTQFDAGALLELTQSIEELGQMQPIVLVQAKNETVLIAGERRLRAAKKIGHLHVRAMVYRKLTDRQIADMQLAENFQRRDLNHIETARALAKLRDVGASTAEIAAQVHKSAGYVREHLDLLRLTDPIQELVGSGRLPIKQAAMIARVGDLKNQIGLVYKATGLLLSGTQWEQSRGDEDSPDDDVMSMTRLRDRVASAMRSLGTKGWPMGEEYCKLRACKDCPDNTAAYADQPMLFAGVRPKGSAKKGHCTNETCYRTKETAWEKVLHAKRKQRAKDKTVKIARAKRAGLDICEECGKVAGVDEQYSANNTPAQKLCPKCDEKLKKRMDRGGGESYHACKNRINDLKKKFPWDDEQRMAVATHQWGEKLADAIGNRMAAEGGIEHAAYLILWAQGYLSYGSGVPDGVTLRAEDAINGKMPAENLAACWMESSQWVRERDPRIGYDGDVENVPLAKSRITRLNDLATIADALPAFDAPPRPTADSIAYDAVRDVIVKGNRADSLKAIAECEDANLLGCMIQLPPAAGGVKKPAAYRVKAISERIAELQGGTVGEREEVRWEEAKTPDEMQCQLDVAQRDDIAYGKRAEALIAIDECTLTTLLTDAQDVEGGLKGDWRRAAVAKRLKHLTAAGERGEAGGENYRPL